MPAIHLRNVPESVLVALRERARRRGRSMQREILEILERAAKEPGIRRTPEPLRLVTVKTAGTQSTSREDLYGDDGR